MGLDPYVIVAGAAAIGALLFLLRLVRSLQGRNRSIDQDPGLWEERDYRCPGCGTPMDQGWVLLGKGAIWSPRSKGTPGVFAPIGSALENTINMSLRPAFNMAWHCSGCHLLVLDHGKLVTGKK